MGFFDDVGGFFEDVGNSVGGAFKDAGGAVWDNVFKPIGQGASTVGQGAVELAKKYEAKADRLSNAAVGTAEGFSNFMSSPIFLYTALGVGAVVVIMMLRR